jgi:D-mannonate dehydratase
MAHIRNIKGGYRGFNEAFPDDGDVDLAAAIRAYR